MRGPPGVSERGLVHERLLEVDVRVLDVLSERSDLSNGFKEPERDERRKRCEKRRDRKKWGRKEGKGDVRVAQQGVSKNWPPVIEAWKVERSAHGLSRRVSVDSDT